MIAMNPMTRQPVFIIAEAGVNHNGSLGLAQDLVRAAHEAGADAVKFQTFTADNLLIKGTPTLAYQKQNTAQSDQYVMLKCLELSQNAHHQLKDLSDQLGIEFMSTALDQASAQFLYELGLTRFKISSGDLTNHPFLEQLAGYGRPMILSTGMANMAEVAASVGLIKHTLASAHPNADLADYLTVLHCTSSYPAPYDQLNLNAMPGLGKSFGVPYGYSDHSEGIFIATIAAAMGASVIEKHLTLDKTLPGPDHKASIEPDEFAQMVRDIHAVGPAMGDSTKAPSEEELETRKLIRKSLVLARDCPKDHALMPGDLALLRPGTGIEAKNFNRVIGKKLKRRLPAGHTLAWADLVDTD